MVFASRERLGKIVDYKSLFKFPSVLVAFLLLSSAIFAQGSLIEVAKAEPVKPSTIYGFVLVENIIKTIYPSKDALICPSIA
ncbi:MAG: hypothetical protein DRN61_02855, partial [Thaumarchaeota archaeon]